MKVSKYLEQLVNDGTWGKMSAEGQSIFLYILVRSQGEYVKITYSQYVNATGVSKGLIKKKLDELVSFDLIVINPDTKEVKPKADIDFSDGALPLPPVGDNEVESDLYSWVQETLSSPLGMLLGAVIVGYIIKLWLEWISQKEDTDPWSNFPTFIDGESVPRFGLDKLNKLSINKVGKDIAHLSPEEIHLLFQNESEV
jgi:hypothetical protein